MIRLDFEQILLIELKHTVKSKRSITWSGVPLAFFNSQGALPCLLWDPVCKTPDWETQVINCSCLYWFWIHCFETNILLEIALSQTFTWSGSWGQRQSRLGRASREEKRLSALRFLVLFCRVFLMCPLFVTPPPQTHLFLTLKKKRRNLLVD